MDLGFVASPHSKLAAAFAQRAHLHGVGHSAARLTVQPEVHTMPLLSIDEVMKFDDASKHPCDLCQKPLVLLYRISLDEGGTLVVCRSDLHRIITMKAQTRKASDRAEPLFAGSNDRVK